MEVLLERAGIDRAKGVVMAIPNVEIAEGVVRNILMLLPDLPTYARALFLPHLERLEKAGATTTVEDEREAGRAIVRVLLDLLGVRPELVESVILRADSRQSTDESIEKAARSGP